MCPTYQTSTITNDPLLNAEESIPVTHILLSILHENQHTLITAWLFTSDRLTTSLDACYCRRAPLYSNTTPQFWELKTFPKNRF